MAFPASSSQVVVLPSLLFGGRSFAHYLFPRFAFPPRFTADRLTDRRTDRKDKATDWVLPSLCRQLTVAPLPLSLMSTTQRKEVNDTAGGFDEEVR